MDNFDNGLKLITALEQLSVHDHLCLIYETQKEQFAAVIPFIRIGLERREKCIYIVDDNTAQAVLDSMRDYGIDADTALKSGALVIAHKQDAYLKQGCFDPDRLLRFLKEAADQATAEGFSALRATGEMTWVFGGDSGTERLIEYEAKLNYFFPENNALAVCQYNRRRFPPEIIRDVIYAHPLVIYSNMVCKNPYYVPPDEFLCADRTSKETERLLKTIYQHQQIEQTLKNEIDERTKIEESLRESEERYRRMVDAVTTYTYFVEIREGRAVSTSHSMGCLPVTGYKPEDYASNPYLWYSMIHPDDRTMVEGLINAILSGHEVQPVEHRVVRCDGAVVWVRNTIIPHYDSAGRLTRYDGLVENITERKRLEDELRQAQKMEAVGKLAGGIAHDFNNILTAIIGYANLIHRKIRKDDPLYVYAEQILASAGRAANLTQGLLAFSRKQIINPMPVALNDIVRRVGKLLLSLISEDIELKTVLTDKALIVVADSGQIEQVLMNLSTNARDSMPAGGLLTIQTELVELSGEYLKTHSIEKPGEYAVISISDTGVGIDEAAREKIFEPFFTTKGVGKGTGLGLSIVYGIIKQHDGYIDVYSETGKGTTFRLYLPLIKSEVEKTAAREIAVPKGGTETVLIAEDASTVRALTREILEEFGYKVIEAADGEDAVEKFMQNRGEVQLLLLDVVMPKLNGKEAYERIRKIDPDVKALFMSGYTADIIHRKGILEEEINFVSKPVLPDTLLRKIREILDK